MSAYSLRIPPWFHRRSTRRWSTLLSLGLVAGTLTVLAVRSDGQPVVDVSLNDGSVWVTNSSSGLLGRLNPAVGELDLGVEAASDVDVMQSAYDVLMSFGQGEQAALKVLNVAAGSASSAVGLPEESRVAYGGGTVAVEDPESGAVWVRTMDTILGFTAKDTPSDLQTSPDGVVTIGVDGMVHAVDRRSGRVVRSSIGASGVAGPEAPAPLSGGLPTTSGDLLATVVGRRDVVLARESGELFTRGNGPAVLEEPDRETAQLQQPSSAGGVAYIGVHDGLRMLDLEGGQLSTMSTPRVSGAPAAPVVVEGCVHAAWAVDDVAAVGYVRSCPGEELLEMPIPGIQPGSELVFRVNRDVVVLNDTRTGDSWYVRDDSLEKVDNWSDIDPNQGTKQQKDKTEEDEPDRTLLNIGPTAEDDKGRDELGARAGRATTLPVTANDTDPNGDILTIDSFTPPRGVDGAVLSVVGKGTELQLDLPADARGTVTFQYTIVDGQGGRPDTADVSVRISPPGQNALPAQRDPVEATVGSGATRSMFVMPDWRDPDGDDMVLTSATARGGGSVEFTGDGMVTYLDDNSGPGVRTIDLTMSDGMEPDGEVATGTALVTVTDARRLPPELLPDRVVGQVGTDVLVKPLANDSSPDGSELTLGRVTGDSDLTIVSDPQRGTFSVRGASPGAYYLDYKAFNTSGNSTSYIRLDVLPQSQENRPPVAVKDVAVLTGGDAALVDLLQNDYDPDTDVLVVQSVDVPRDSGLKVVLIDKQQVRVEATSELSQPVSIAYTVSDGERTAIGRLQVLPGGAGQLNRPPIAERDDVTVRAGGITSIRVLANDRDPDRDRLEIRQTELDNPENLLLFASGGRFRLRAPKRPGTYRAVYTVRDSEGATDSAQIVLTVLPNSARNNRPPDPRPTMRRAFTGETLRVRIDTSGADPDGDAVRISDIVDPPRLGRIVGYGLDYVDYEPRDGAVGTDTLRVTLEDAFGAQARTDIRIGVAPRSPVNQPPVALDDQIEIRPGRTIQYAVTANDRDPDEDQLTVAKDLRVKEGVQASTEDGFVAVTVPKGDERSTQRVGYTVTDGLGGYSSAVLMVTGDPDAPLWAPRTRDDTVDPAKVLRLRPGQTVEENVLANDGDIDGLASDLALSSVDSGATVAEDGVSLVVTVQKTSQVLAYQVTDADGAYSYGFVFVPGTNDIAPLVDPTAIPLKVDQGESLADIPVSDVVLVRRGRTPILTVKGELSADHADGSPLLLDKSTLAYTPEPAFYGADALNFEVTDGTSLNDASGLLSRLTVPIRVEPARNHPPTMRGTEVVVGPDEDTVISLVGLTDDPNSGDRKNVAFDVVKGDAEVLTWSVDGGDLRLRATDVAQDGDEQTLTVRATDPSGAAATASVAVQVVAAAAPLVSVRPTEVVGVADQGLSVDVGALAVNPFPGEALVVSDAQVVSGEADDPDVSGTLVSVTPREPGQVVTVLYRINDHLEAPSREVVGRIRISVLDEDQEATGRGGSGSGDDANGTGKDDDDDTEEVIGRPDPPSRPVVESVESGRATLSWDQPVDNGGPITAYIVTGGPTATRCTSTVCTVGSLANGTPYRFRVAAVNKAGTGRASEPSDEVIPADLPAIMTAPRVTSDAIDKDSKLSVSWTAPDDGGSAITSFTIREVSTGVELIAEAGSDTITFNGLTNGETYQFVARANTAESTRSGRQQAFSEPSAPAVPFGKPSFDGVAVTATSPNDGAAGGVVSVAWGRADDNGSPVTQYRVTMSVNGVAQAPRAVGPDPSPTNFSVQNGKNYAFTVDATNGAGSSVSAVSNSVNPFGRASAPRSVEVQPGSEGDHRATVRWQSPSDDGGRPAGMRYRVTAGGQTSLVSTTSAQLVGLPNSPTAVIVQTVTYNDGAPVDGGSESTTVRPYGPPLSASVTASRGYREVTFFVNKDAAENGRPVEQYSYRTRWLMPGPSWSGWTPAATTSSGSVTVNAYHGGNDAQIEVTPLANEGGAGATTTTTGTAAEKTIDVRKGNKVAGGYQIVVVGGGFKDEAFTITFRTSGCGGCAPPAPVSGASTNNGNFTASNRIYGGPGQISVTISQSGIEYVWPGWVSGWDQ